MPCVEQETDLSRGMLKQSRHRAERPGDRHHSSAHLLPRALVWATAFAIVAVALLAAWALKDVLLLVFAAVLLSLGLQSLGDRLSEATGLSRPVAVPLCLLVIVGGLAGIFYLFGQQIWMQLSEVGQQLPKTLETFANNGELPELKSLLGGFAVGDLAANILSLGTAVVGVGTSLVLVGSAAVYLAIRPDTYRAGFLALFPEQFARRVDAAIADCADTLPRWFGGQLLSMTLVAAMTTVGLFFIGVPAFLGLGLIAGLLAFVPIIGPIAGAVPAILLASLQDWNTVLAVVALFVVVQQIENNLILPYVVGRSVEMPEALGLFGTIGLGVLLGPLGLLFGYPLLIVIQIAVRHFYLDRPGDKLTSK